MMESAEMNYTVIGSDFGTTISTLDVLTRNYKQVHGYIASMICVFGIILNICNIYILSQRNMRSSPTYVLLNALATCDLVTALAYLPFAIYFYIVTVATPDYGHAREWLIFAVVSTDLQHVSHTAAMWLTVSIATFRFIYVCKHNIAQIWCSTNRAYIAIALVVLSSVLMCLPTFMCYAVTEIDIHDPVRNLNITTVWTGETQICKKSSGILKIITHLVFGGVIKCSACVALVYFTVMLLRSMHKAKERRKALTGNNGNSDKSKANRRTTAMLITLVILFVITELPQGILVLVSSVSDDFFQKVYGKLADLIDLIVLVNSSINFILYATMSQRFRETFHQQITEPIISRFKSKGTGRKYKEGEEYSYRSVPQLALTGNGLNKDSKDVKNLDFSLSLAW